MISLAIGFITGRKDCKFEWFAASLANQMRSTVKQVVVVDFYSQVCDDWTQRDVDARREYFFDTASRFGMSKMLAVSPPKPTIWAGPHRVTKENWWHVANCRNTFFCLARTDWVACNDDRCVLGPKWMDGVRHAINHNCIAYGAYEKHFGLRVKRGRVIGSDRQTAWDNREAIASGKIVRVDGSWAYGCTFAMPLKWALDVNGVPEKCDGMSFEDICYGKILEQNKYPMKYLPQMKVIQDRTPGSLDKPFRREDKGELGTERDKSHASLIHIAAKTRSENEFDLREERERVLRGEPWRIPDRTDPRDWFDNSPIIGL
jgi:hypothetical protein